MGMFDVIRGLLGADGLTELADSVGMGDQIGALTEGLGQPLEELDAALPAPIDLPNPLAEP